MGVLVPGEDIYFCLILTAQSVEPSGVIVCPKCVLSMLYCVVLWGENKPL